MLISFVSHKTYCKQNTLNNPPALPNVRIRAENEKSVICFQFELKETGHTPELTTEHDGKEVPVKKQAAANRKPPLCKSRSQEADRQTVDSR